MLFWLNGAKGLYAVWLIAAGRVSIVVMIM